jgi:HlyD family secretion protein
MNMRRQLLVFALIAAGGGAYWLLWPKEEKGRSFQGYLEGNLVFMAPEEGGRIDRLVVEVGDRVREGQVLFGLDGTLQLSQRNEAEARLRQAEAQLANLRAAQQRPEQIAVLQAARDRARAALVLSSQELQRQRALGERGFTPQARLEQAQGAYDRDKASLEEAERQIKAALISSRAAEIDAAAAAAGAAEATLRGTETRLAKREVAAATSALVQDIFFRPGEVVNAGQPVLSLLPPANLKVRFYVPETLLATFALGQTVAVTCDSCPDGLSARITFISREAEFTPPVIFSQQERAKLVFRIEARPTAELRLPIGLPVSVVPAAPAPAGEMR